MIYRRSYTWYVHYPGEVYANDLEFTKPLNETEVRKYLREFHKARHLSYGTQLWIK